MKYLSIALLLLLCSSVTGADRKKRIRKYGYIRMFAAASKHPKWRKRKTARGKMDLVYRACLEQADVSDPVSDRYMVTCYGGTIDLVQFFMLASEVCRGKKHSERLHREWLSEGGREHRNGVDWSQPPEAHPDDLPSSALGALWGHELRTQKTMPGFNLFRSFSEFVKPLIPVPDSIAKQFSHKRIVLGLSDQASRDFRNSRRTWFKAAPLVQTELLNTAAKEMTGSQICKDTENGEDALLKAGFILVNYEGAPILILRRVAGL